MKKPTTKPKKKEEELAEELALQQQRLGVDSELFGGRISSKTIEFSLTAELATVNDKLDNLLLCFVEESGRREAYTKKELEGFLKIIHKALEEVNQSSLVLIPGFFNTMLEKLMGVQGPLNASTPQPLNTSTPQLLPDDHVFIHQKVQSGFYFKKMGEDRQGPPDGKELLRKIEALESEQQDFEVSSSSGEHLEEKLFIDNVLKKLQLLKAIYGEGPQPRKIKIQVFVDMPSNLPTPLPLNSSTPHQLNPSTSIHINTSNINHIDHNESIDHPADEYLSPSGLIDSETIDYFDQEIAKVEESINETLRDRVKKKVKPGK